MPSSSLRIATWNINSVRLRLPLIERVTAALAPHILCLQETKVEDALFPHQALSDLGFPYRSVRGEKSYNGVAVLSKFPIVESSHIAFCDKSDARHLAVRIACHETTLSLHNLYVPAGGYVADAKKSEKFAHKLSFVDEMSRRFADAQTDTEDDAQTDAEDDAKTDAEAEQPCVLLGDLNIAPLENDVWDHEKMLRVVSHTPEEVALFTRAQKARGWCDVLRETVPAQKKLYTWWSYRQPQWREKNYGRRLDHIWANRALAPLLTKTEVLKEARGWEQPSDHVPVMAEFALS